MRGKFIAVVLAGILAGQWIGNVLPAMAVEAGSYGEAKADLAAPPEGDRPTETQTENMQELQDMVMQQQKEMGCFPEQSQTGERQRAQEETFASKTLLVIAQGAFDSQGASHIISNDRGLYVLIYETADMAQQAYEAFKAQIEKGKSPIRSVTVDTAAYVADSEEGALGQDKECKEYSAQGQEEDTNKTKGSALREYLEENKTEEQVAVAVIDTGWEKGRAEGMGGEERIIDTGWNLSASGEKGSIQDDNGHGTQLVRILLRETQNNVKIIPIKAADGSGRATILSTYLALMAAIDQKADVILLSMNRESGKAELLSEGVRQAHAQGISVIVSAGNYHKDVLESPPADIPEAIVVSGVEDGTAAGYSNFGETVDVCSEGCYKDETREGAAVEGHGTSYAAARTAAAVAMLRTFLKDNREAEDALKQYAQDLGEKEWDPYYGHGYVGMDMILEDISGNHSFEEPEGDYIKVPEDLELSVQNSTYISTVGHYFVEVAYKESTMKYQITCSLSEASHYGSQTLTQSKKRLAGQGTHLLVETPNAAMEPDGRPGWDQNDRMYVIPSEMSFLKIPGYHMELDCNPENLVQAWSYQIDGYDCWIRHTTNSVGMTDWYEEEAGFHHNTYRFRYVPNRYTIVYDGNGADYGGMEPFTVLADGEFKVKPDLFRRQGYEFKGYTVVRKSDNTVYCGSKGWQPVADSQNICKVFQKEELVKLDSNWINKAKGDKNDAFTLKAQWEKQNYTICYEGNGAESGNISSHTVVTGKQFTFQDNRYKRKGYQFQGYMILRKSDHKVKCQKGIWKLLDGSTEKEWKLYQPGETYTMDHNWINKDYSGNSETFFCRAQWKKRNYTVTYHANGGKSVSKAKASVAYGDEIDLSVKAVPKDDYYTFVGWGTDPKDNTALFSGKMDAKDITLYALYSIPVSDVKEVYLKVEDKTGKKSKNGKLSEIYPLKKTGETDSPVRGYRYKLKKLDYKERFPGSISSDMMAAIFAVDYAGNSSRIKTYNGGEKIVSEPVYEQSVVHKFQDLDTGKDTYKEIGSYLAYQGTDKEELRSASVTEFVRRGLTFTPKGLEAPLPEGYRFNSNKSTGIGKTYTVTGEQVTYAYYDMIPYTLFFDGNGGLFSDKSKTVYTGKTYDYLAGNVHKGFPEAVRKGYSFQGWYTAASGGERIYPSTVYTLQKDSKIYARWEQNKNTVYYDSITNGGTGAGTDTWEKNYARSVNYGQAIDLRVKARKDGWIFVGWNTDPDAQAALKGLTMEDKDIILYAIFKKDITITYIGRTEQETVTRKEKSTIYNRSEGIAVVMPKPDVWNGWEAVGWSLLTDGDADIEERPGAEVYVREDITYYGRYCKDVTVRYDPNGSAMEIPEETKLRQYNASGVYCNPVFILKEGPKRNNHSFVGWQQLKDTVTEDKEGTDQPLPGESYGAGMELELEKDTSFQANWDQYPVIEAYDRYFSLEEAKEGRITTATLLEKVTGTDREDGLLVNGIHVVVLNYNPQDFTAFAESGSIYVTYQATDSFGNQTLRQITAHIVDTEPKEDSTREYVRLISSQFYRRGNQYLSKEEGGLEETSVWKQDAACQKALEYALSNEKRGQITVQETFFGKVYHFIRPGSGSWDHKKETWVFSKEQIENVKQFVEKHGYGDARGENKIAIFYESFGSCREGGNEIVD